MSHNKTVPAVNDRDVRLTLEKTADFLRVNFINRRAVVRFRAPDAAFAVTVADVTLRPDPDGEQELSVRFETDDAFSGFLDDPGLTFRERTFLRGRVDLYWGPMIQIEITGRTLWLEPAGP